MKQIIRKWYQKLNFLPEYDTSFHQLLCAYDPKPMTVAEYMQTEHDASENFLMFLYFCEDLQKIYGVLGIDDEIFYDTLKDIPLWAGTYYRNHGILGINVTDWMQNHMQAKLFKLGRLQFCMADRELEVHIPEGEPLDIERCHASFQQAKAFFAKYFPEFVYDKFTCHSWLLDQNLGKILPEKSNILKFQKLFTPVTSEPSDAAIRYVFGWEETRETIALRTPESSFARKMQDYLLSGGQLYEVTGERTVCW